MSEQKHTGGTWVALQECIWTEYPQGGKASIADMVFGHGVSHAEAEANAARIVSCVNALAGIDDPAKAIERARAVLLRVNECFDLQGDLYIELMAALAALTPKEKR